MEPTMPEPILLPYGCVSLVRVLLIEDDPDAAALTRAQMSGDKDVEFRIEWKQNILNAISRLAKPGIDVVLLDLGMRDLRGYNTHLAICPVTKETPVVIFTSDDSALSRSMTKTQGAFTYLVKNRTSPVELRHALHEAALSSPL
jgi:DNA-binding NarL/FixJ family response regulator